MNKIISGFDSDYFSYYPTLFPAKSSWSYLANHFFRYFWKGGQDRALIFSNLDRQWPIFFPKIDLFLFFEIQLSSGPNEVSKLDQMFKPCVGIFFINASTLQKMFKQFLLARVLPLVRLRQNWTICGKVRTAKLSQKRLFHGCWTATQNFENF